MIYSFVRTFREYLEDQDYDTIKSIVLNILDPQIKSDSKSILNLPLADFETREKILTDPSLDRIIKTRQNRGAIEAAVRNDSTTIGNLISLLTQDKEPKYLG